MSVRNPLPPLRLDATALVNRLRAQCAAAIELAWRRSDAARDALLAAAEREEETPLTESAMVFDLPDRLLGDYQQNRKRSDLGRVLQEAPRLAAEVDRVVVLGDGEFLRGVEALLAACCHPRHNDLSRADRSGQPRIYCQHADADNDAAAGLLDLFAQPPAGDLYEHRWALVVSENPHVSHVSATLWRHWLAALWQSCGQDATLLAQRLLFSTTPDDTLVRETLTPPLPPPSLCRKLSNTLELRDGQSPFTPACLLVAALAGIDVVRLLRGAAAMNAQFREAPPQENAPVALAAIVEALRAATSVKLSLLKPATASLGATGHWLEGILLSKLRRGGHGPLAITLPADMIDAAPEQDPLGHDTLTIHVTVDGVRRDRLTPAAIAEPPVNEASGENIALRLPLCDEGSLGQLLQCFLLATELQELSE